MHVRRPLTKGHLSKVGQSCLAEGVSLFELDYYVLVLNQPLSRQTLFSKNDLHCTDGE